jgi:hypothetical protein
MSENDSDVNLAARITRKVGAVTTAAAALLSQAQASTHHSEPIKGLLDRATLTAVADVKKSSIKLPPPLVLTPSGNIYDGMMLAGHRSHSSHSSHSSHTSHRSHVSGASHASHYSSTTAPTAPRLVDGPKVRPPRGKLTPEAPDATDTDDELSREKKKRREAEAEAAKLRKELDDTRRAAEKDDPARLLKKQEDEAERKFRLAKMLWESGKKDTARKRMHEIIDSYPDTKAADTARKFLGLPKKDKVDA